MLQVDWHVSEQNQNEFLVSLQSAAAIGTEYF